MSNVSAYQEFLNQPRHEALKYTNVSRWIKDLSLKVDNKVPAIIDIAPNETRVIDLNEIITSGVSSINDVTINVGLGARVEIFDQVITYENSWHCRALQINVSSYAICNHYVFIAGIGVQTCEVRVNVTAYGAYHAIHLNTSAGKTRNDMRVELHAQATGTIRAAQLLKDTAHHDLTTCFAHIGGDSRSAQNIRNIVDGMGRGVYQGKIFVGNMATQANGQQQCRTILLSSTAEIDVKPELEIYTDDVQCAHGASSGYLNPDQLFYLQARGIDENTARMLLLRGFIADLFDQTPDEFMSQADAWLRQGVS
jgi:Fe-S cluster assembly scaffold protein SufB